MECISKLEGADGRGLGILYCTIWITAPWHQLLHPVTTFPLSLPEVLRFPQAVVRLTGNGIASNDHTHI